MIEVLVSTIASGKSTWAKKLANDDWIVLNGDGRIINQIEKEQKESM